MKNLYNISFCLLVLSLGCNQQTKPDQKPDTRPQNELSFIKIFTKADSVYSAQHNEIGKKEVVDSSKATITHFITDNLQAKIENWQAVVKRINVDGLDGAIDVTLMVSKGAELDEKHPDFNAIILKSHIADNDQIKALLKPLSEGSKVLVTGAFLTDKNKEGNIDFDTYSLGSIDPEELLTNPQFNISITDISKIKHTPANN